MKKPVYVIATIKPWNIIRAKEFARKNRHCVVHIVTSPQELTINFLKKVLPKYVFFVHWSWKISAEIHDNFECVLFHMTDLPFGRGGSPLQNLIVRGITRTKISALKVVNEIDAGPIYMKRSLSLQGKASDIFENASVVIFTKMLPYIIKYDPAPKLQKGTVVIFKRRIPAQSDIGDAESIRKIYDTIRMLDAQGYPKAFIQGKRYIVEFFDARLAGGKVIAQATIRMKEKI